MVGSSELRYSQLERFYFVVIGWGAGGGGGGGGSLSTIWLYDFIYHLDVKTESAKADSETSPLNFVKVSEFTALNISILPTPKMQQGLNVYNL